MSYRDLRNFIEMLHELGYPRLISMENFRIPNFPLVAEILVWLVQRFDPDVDIPFKIFSEDDRVLLIRSVTQFLFLKENLKLNTKKLYQADGYAVKEMLKVASMLYDSLKSTEVKKTDANDMEVSVLGTAMKAQEFTQINQIVRDIVSSGATLFDMLGKEEELKELRNSIVSRQIEIPQVEQAVRNSIKDLSREMENIQESIKTMTSNETNLDSKIDRRKSDLDRHTKRLQTLKKIRPAFMEEFEKLEEDLKKFYSDYVIKCRNVSYLENILEQTEIAQQKRMEQKQVTTRKLEELKQDELSIQSGDVFPDTQEDNYKTSLRHRESLSRKSKIRKDASIKRQGTREAFRNVTSNMNDSDSLEDSDSDLLLDGDITEDEDIEIDNQSIQDFSDDNF